MRRVSINDYEFENCSTRTHARISRFFVSPLLLSFFHSTDTRDEKKRRRAPLLTIICQIHHCPNNGKNGAGGGREKNNAVVSALSSLQSTSYHWIVCVCIWKKELPLYTFFSNFLGNRYTLVDFSLSLSLSSPSPDECQNVEMAPYSIIGNIYTRKDREGRTSDFTQISRPTSRTFGIDCYIAQCVSCLL